MPRAASSAAGWTATRIPVPETTPEPAADWPRRPRKPCRRGGLAVNRQAETLEQQLEARDPDVRLMVQVRADEPGAFEALVERYQNRLVGVLFHLVGSIDEA